MVGRSYAQEGHHLAPKGGGKLAALVRDDPGRDAKPRDPAPEETGRTGRCRDVCQRDGLNPPRETVDDGEEIGISLKGWQMTNKDDIEDVKPPIRQGQVLKGSFGMAENF